MAYNASWLSAFLLQCSSSHTQQYLELTLPLYFSEQVCGDWIISCLITRAQHHLLHYNRFIQQYNLQNTKIEHLFRKLFIIFKNIFLFLRADKLFWKLFVNLK